MGAGEAEEGSLLRLVWEAGERANRGRVRFQFQQPIHKVDVTIVLHGDYSSTLHIKSKRQAPQDSCLKIYSDTSKVYCSLRGPKKEGEILAGSIDPDTIREGLVERNPQKLLLT